MMGLGAIGKLVILRAYTATTQSNETKITLNREVASAATFRVTRLDDDHAQTGHSQAIASHRLAKQPSFSTR